MPRQITTGEKHWYVLHTYSGYEDSVVYNLKQRIESMGMEEKIFPGYVLVSMIVTDDSWYVVRNTPNVTGFVGSGTIPTPISDEEVKVIQKRMGLEEPKYKIEFVVHDLVRITDGPFKGYEGKVSEIDEAKGKIKVLISIFGRETPVELDFLQAKKI